MSTPFPPTTGPGRLALCMFVNSPGQASTARDGFRSGLSDYSGTKEALDLCLGDAGGAEDLDGVLADFRGEGGGHLLVARDVERARHGVRSARPRIVDGHQRAAREHLGVVAHVVEGGDHAEGDAGLLEDGRPRRPVLGLEPRIEDGGESTGVRATGVGGLEARVERSEGRRVGKECRSRWAPYQWDKK